MSDRNSRNVEEVVSTREKIRNTERIKTSIIKCNPNKDLNY